MKKSHFELKNYVTATSAFCPGGCGRNFDFLWVRAEICAGEFSENFKDQCGKTERASVDDSGYQLSVSE